MKIAPGTVMKKTDFYRMFSTENVWKKRRDDVLVWAMNFFDYDIDEKTNKIIINEQLEEEILPIPRKKGGGRKSTKEEVDAFYKALALKTIQGTTKENALYMPGSVMVRVNKDLIKSKYNHKDSTAAKYMNKALNTYTDYTEAGKWVWINKQSTLCEPLTPQEQQELYSYQVESAVEASELAAAQLDKINLQLAGKTIYSTIAEVLEDTKVYLQGYYTDSIKKMIQAHPEKNATFIVRTLGKFEGKYIFDERMLQLLEDAGL